MMRSGMPAAAAPDGKYATAPVAEVFVLLTDHVPAIVVAPVAPGSLKAVINDEPPPEAVKSCNSVAGEVAVPVSAVLISVAAASSRLPALPIV